MKPVAAIVSAVLCVAGVALAQSATATRPNSHLQTPRQALLEILRAKDGSALERHLPEVTKTKLEEMGAPLTGGAKDLFGGMPGIGPAAGAKGANFVTEDSGPVVMTLESPNKDANFELTMQRDNLVGDEDDMELGFHMSQPGEQQDMAHYFAPTLLLHWKQEQSVWRLEDIGFSLHAPIGNPEFLDAMEQAAQQAMQKKQQAAGGIFASMALDSVNDSEEAYQKKHGTYSCSVKELDADSASASSEGDLQSALDLMKQYNLALQLSGCTASGYNAAVVPSAGKGKAYCTDQNKNMRYSDDGSAESCITSGQAMK